MSNLFSSGIRPAVDAHLLELSREMRDYGDYWSASQAGYCMRKVIFERLGVPRVEKEDDARKQRVFSVGHIFHEFMQKITKDAGLSIAQELELQDEELMIRGHIDDLVLVTEQIPEGTLRSKASPPKHLILYDYKSVNSRSFNYKRDKMSHYHRLQLGTYMYMLRRRGIEGVTKNHNLDLDLTEARILNISKDDLRMAELQLLWSPDLERDVINYWKTLNGYWKNKKLPNCTCADYEGGFMADPRFNPYYYQDEPCSLKWYEKYKEEKNEKDNG